MSIKTGVPTESETIENYQHGQDEETLRAIRRNIETLKREKALGTRIDAASIEDLEDEFRKLTASLQKTPKLDSRSDI